MQKFIDLNNMKAQEWLKWYINLNHDPAGNEACQ